MGRKKEIRKIMCRREIIPEQIFYDRIKSLIQNLLVTNPNYDNGYFWDQSKHDFKSDVIERSTYILEELESMKHLINL